MTRLRTTLTVLLGLLLLFDGVTALRVWWYGLKTVSINDGRVSVESISFTSSDWGILLLVVLVHAALICAVWKAWCSAPVRS